MMYGTSCGDERVNKSAFIFFLLILVWLIGFSKIEVRSLEWNSDDKELDLNWNWKAYELNGIGTEHLFFSNELNWIGID